MGIIDSIKNILTIPNDDEYDEEYEEAVEKEEPKRKPVAQQEPVKRSEPSARVLGGGKSKTVSYATSPMQVVIVKPEKFDDVRDYADHLNEGKTVVLNLESSEKDVARRIVDFLTGAAYAIHGNMRKVSKSTFLIVPNGVDMMGELFLDDFDESKMYF